MTKVAGLSLLAAVFAVMPVQAQVPTAQRATAPAIDIVGNLLQGIRPLDENESLAKRQFWQNLGRRRQCIES